MNPQELIRFEHYVRSCGYNTRKEGGRYCHGVVNLLKDAWFIAQKGMAASGMEPQEPRQPTRHAHRAPYAPRAAQPG